MVVQTAPSADPLRFTVMGVPVAKGRPRMAVVRGHAMAYTPAKTRKAEETFAARVMPHAPKEPLECPVALDLLFVLPIPLGWSKQRRTDCAVQPEPHCVRPDLDNLVKLAKDAMTGLFWVDDKLVCDVHARKVYGEIPRTEVTISV